MPHHEPEPVRLRQAVDASGEVIFMTDREGVFTFVNPQFERLYGYSSAEVVGRATPRVLKGGDVEPEEYATLWERLLRGESVERTFVNRTRDGRRVDIDATVSPIHDEHRAIVGFMAIQRDVTARNHEIRERQLAEEQLRLISDNMLDLVSQVALDGTFRYVSPSYRHVLGYDPRRLVGTSAFALVHADDVERARSVFADAVDRRDTGRLEFRAIRADGSSLWMEAVGKVLVDGANEPTGAILSSRDISERKHNEAVLRQSQKLEAIGSLAGGIAHDFNNLLTAIIGYAELVAADLEADAPVRPDVDEIVRAARSAESLTRQLLIFSRKSIVQPVDLRLDEVIARLERLLGRMVGEHIEFDVSLDRAAGLVRADPGQIEQVLMNLVVNARDAMPTGGALTITTGAVELDTAFARAHDGTSVGPFVFLAVADTGCGMSPDVQAQMFDPFFTTKGPDKGTGLGLATVHAIVQQAHGYIVVESRVGRGTTFTVYLPRVAGSGDGFRVERETEVALSGSETILFVEDDERIRALAVRALQRWGYSVVSARDAVEALTLARRNIGALDLLVTDIVMPGVNGRALAERLRSSHEHLKVVYVSGFTDDSELLSGIRSGGTPFLQKPYTMERLAGIVRRTLDQ